MKNLIGVSAAALSLAIALPAAAQSSGTPMPGMGKAHQMGGNMQNTSGMHDMAGMTPMQHEVMMAMQRMDQAMMAAEDSNPDRAFAKKMMAHHEGAIAMSEIEIRMGKDAEAKRIAEETIKENRQGVAKLKSFLARH